MLGWHKSPVSLHGPTKKKKTKTFFWPHFVKNRNLHSSNSVAGLDYSSDHQGGKRETDLEKLKDRDIQPNVTE